MKKQFTLRDGSKVTDKRLGRLRPTKLDPRNLPLAEVLSPRGTPVTKFWKLTRAFDQGAIGMCCGTGSGHVLAAEPLFVDKIYSRFSPTGVYDLDLRFCKEDIYWAAEAIDGFPGGDYPGAGRYSEGTGLLATARICRKWDFITEFRWAKTIQEIKLGMSYIGPCMMGIPWYSKMFEPDTEGIIPVKGYLAGYHALCFLGLDMENKRFAVQQSWGPKWGITIDDMPGRAYITFDGLKKLFQDSFSEGCFFIKKIKQ